MLLKLDGFKKLMVYLPSAVCPLEATFSVHRPYEGFVSKGEFHLLALVDRSPWETAADYGSKVWLMSEVLLSVIKDLLHTCLSACLWVHIYAYIHAYIH